MDIYKANEEKKVYNQDSLSKTLLKRWLSVNGYFVQEVQPVSIDELFRKTTMMKYGCHCKEKAGTKIEKKIGSAFRRIKRFLKR